jgi:hypothetical protein
MEGELGKENMADTAEEQRNNRGGHGERRDWELVDLTISISIFSIF